MSRRRPGAYTDVDAYLDQQNRVFPEEFPDGAYGAPDMGEARMGKSSPWEHAQKTISRERDMIDPNTYPYDANLAPKQET